MTLTYGDVRAHFAGARETNEPASVRVHLAKKSVMSLTPTKHKTAIRCWSGKLWVTKTGDRTDYVLSAGDYFPLPASGRIVVEALEEAVVGLS